MAFKTEYLELCENLREGPAELYHAGVPGRAKTYVCGLTDDVCVATRRTGTVWNHSSLDFQILKICPSKKRSSDKGKSLE